MNSKSYSWCRRFWAALVIGAVLVLGGCGRNDDGDRGAASGQPNETNAQAANIPDKIRFTTNWFAEAEHGGFYEAKANGLYKKRFFAYYRGSD